MNKDILSKKLFDDMLPRQKQYEALRALAKNKTKTFDEVAKQFGYKPQSLRNMVSLVMKNELSFFQEEQPGPKQPRLTSEVIKKIIKLRRQERMSVEDIQNSIIKENVVLSISTINRVLTNAGFLKLARRTNKEKGITKKNTLISDRATILAFEALQPFNIDCPVAGVFLFLPYILESQLLSVVSKCNLPESKDIGAIQASLAMLLLKLIGTERLSHIKSYDHEPSLGIFAGLNCLPKDSYMGSYSCRTSEDMLFVLQKELLTVMKKRYPEFYSSSFINLDFHGIPHFGGKAEMEKIWCGARGKALKGANTLFAQDSSSNAILYSKADILRKNETQEIKQFVEYWKKVQKRDVLETLVFDCKLTKYSVLGELDSDDIKFITLRKRNKTLLEMTNKIPESQWNRVKLPIPKRKHQKFLVHENEVYLKDCQKPLRQIIIKDHGRNQPTFVISNNKNLPLLKILEVYAKRWHIENKLSELVSFFNLNALSSPLMIRIHFDIFWTIVADTFYHILAKDLPRFEHCRANTIFKKFINFPGRLKYDGDKFIVEIRKRAHTPILLGVEKLNKPVPVPWLNHKTVEIHWRA